MTQGGGSGEPEPPSPDEVFVLRLQDLLTVFTDRQSEILRLADYMDEQAAEIDKPARRARELIKSKLNESEIVNDQAVDALIGLFSRINDDDLGNSELTGEQRQDALITALRDVELPEGLASTYVSSVLRALYQPPGVGVLKSSLLVTLVGETEQLVNQLARAAFERRPRALGEGGRTFTWDEISSFDSIDDMRDIVVDRTIEDVLRGSLSDWVDYFAKRFSINSIAAAREYPAQEAVQRRHCIVHNGGRASTQYVEKLEQFDPALEIDDDLSVDTEYLRRAADALFLVGYSLVWAIGFKLCQGDEQRSRLGAILANRTYYLLQERRFLLVRNIASSVPLDRLEEGVAFVIQVNRWLSFKLTGEFDEVRAEVEALKLESKSRDFNLAKLALLDRHEEAFRVAQSMIRDEQLRPEFLFTWPLLAGVSEYARNSSGDAEVAPGQ